MQKFLQNLFVEDFTLFINELIDENIIDRPHIHFGDIDNIPPKYWKLVRFTSAKMKDSIEDKLSDCNISYVVFHGKLFAGVDEDNCEKYQKLYNSIDR